MPVISLPDGSQRSYDDPLSVMDIAADIGPGLARATLAAEVDGRLVDASHLVDMDATLRIITARDEEGLEILRHSCAHLMAQAVKELFPEAQVTIGPVIEHGFYYDFSFERSFTPEDLAAIEEKMTELARQDLDVSRFVMARDEAVALFRGQGEEYKAQIIESIPAHEELSLYRQGDFIDLCRGPHVPSTGKLGAFKLTRLAGAYWRGDSRNEMLQRVYGTAWPDRKALKQHLQRLEEAEKPRPPQAGPQAGPVPFPGRGAGAGVLAPERLDAVQHRQGLYPAPAGGEGLPGDQHPDGVGPQPVGEVRPLGQVPGGHVHHQFGKPRLRHQAHELSRPYPSVQPGPQELSRPAPALCGIRFLPP